MRTKQSIIFKAALAVFIGFNSIQANAQTLVFSESYSTTTGWSLVHQKTCPTYPLGTPVSVGPNAFSFNGSNGSVENRQRKSIGTTLGNNWYADFDFFFDLNGHANTIPGHVLAAFTAGSTFDPYNTLSACTYPSSNQDAIVVDFLSTNKTTNPNTWMVFARSKDGTTWSTASSGIKLISGGMYYLRIERLSATQGVLSIFTDPGRTIHLSGSPRCFPISSQTTGLNSLQHGVIPQGGQQRVLWGTIDNMNVYTTNPGITGQATVGCFPACGYPSYDYTISGIPNGTFNTSSWTFTPSTGVVVNYISGNGMTANVSFDCSLAGGNVIVSCTPTFGNGVVCPYSIDKTVQVVACRAGHFDENEASDRVILYPNPNSGSFTFEYEVPEGSTSSLVLTDMMGRKIAAFDLAVGQNSLKIDQVQLEEGIYLYTIIMDGQAIKTEKLSVIR